MTDREKLIEILRVLIFPHELVDPTEALADYMLDNGVVVQQWIPVTERLPEIQQKILVYCESKTIRKHVTACTYMGGYLGAKQFSRHVRNVTHWMPLPEPPKEDE